jgi:hypothetical protein
MFHRRNGIYVGTDSSIFLVGGYEFLLYFYPEVALRVFHQSSTPNKMKLAKTLGAIELALVLLLFSAFR